MKTEEILEPRSEITRRTFCNRVLLTSVGLGLAANNLKGEPVYAQRPPLAYPQLKIEGAERVMPGSFLYFSYPTAKEPAVLVRGHDGEYLAYSRKCAHLGCSVDFDPQRRCFKCPCHQGAYDPRTGYVIYGPPPRPLDQIGLQMRAGCEVWAVGKGVGSSNPYA
ncbi:MAG: Rieske (2Fe-2S) protein [Acidobacteriota bacterium]